MTTDPKPDPNINPVQRYSSKALLDFSNAKAKMFCRKCGIVFLAEEEACPECKTEGTAIVDTRFI